MASTYLTRTQTTGNRTTFTWSGWVKKNDISSSDKFLTSCGTASNFRTQFFFDGSDRLQFYNDDGGSNNMNILTTRVFRDVNAWYHIVLRFDTTQSTASDRIRFYVNGVQETVLTNTTYPSQNADNTQFNYNGVAVDIGRRFYNNTNHWNGSMSHVHFCDGYSYAPTEFGETDSTTGEWKINTSPSVTYGTNGYFILKDGNSVTDQSGNGNNFTVGGGTLTKTEDCPSNVFCTLNKLNSYQPTGTINIQYGNTGFEDGENGSNYSYASGALGANSGKFYWETQIASLAEIDQVGVALASSNFMGAANSDGLQATTYGGKGCQFSNGNKVGDGAQSAYMGAFSANDIMMVALDLDNNKITFGRNGQWANGSGGADQTYENSTAAYTNLTAGEFYFPAQAKRAFGSNYGTNWYNFGNGYFKLTAVASPGTNASGIGIFEYDVPTGFTALSTKGLNE